MPYCSKCGAEIPENSKFCPKCGTSVSAPSAPPAPSPTKTGIDMIGSDKPLQEHWIKRVIALIIDGIILLIAYGILAMIILLPLLISSIVTWNFGALWYGGWLGFPFILGVLSILYFSLAESMYGQTLGKRFMGLKVTTVDGKMPSLEKAFIRNLSKIYWVLLLLDVFGGLITQGDPHQKYSDRIAGTTVTTIA